MECDSPKKSLGCFVVKDAPRNDEPRSNDDTYLLAFSGGLDSSVLLSYLCELRKQTPFKLRAIHIHHGLSPNADTWALHCQQTCELLDVEYIEKRINLDLKNGDSLEETARDARYAVLADCLQEGETLLSAHHQDDQAETLLLQLLRGAGLKGLSAMPVLKPFAKGFHARPLLSVSRDEIHQYALEKGLEWMEDESNQNTQLSRNFIRHEVMPLLKRQWPAAEAALSRSAAHCAEAQALLDEYALADCEKIKGAREGTLSVKGLLSLSSDKQRLMLRTWIHQCGFPLPDTKKMKTIQATVLTAAPDRMPCVKWGEVEIRRYRDDLFVMGGERGEAKYRQGGERLYIPNRGHVSLKKLFQEWGVPPWERAGIALVYEGDRLVKLIVFRDFFDVTLPILAFGALVKYLCTCCGNCRSCCKGDMKKSCN